MERLHLCALYTDENAVLKERFVSSFKDDWTVEILHRGRLGEGGGDFGSPGFERAVRDKMDFLARRVRELPGRILLWSDVDIQFFRPAAPAILESLEGRDALFLAEHWPAREINTGFIVIRCNDRTLRFFEAIRDTDFSRLPYHEQSAINDRLTANPDGLSWDVLPATFWCKSSGGLPPPGIILHHANCTRARVEGGRRVSSLELKLAQLDQVSRQVARYGRRPWLRACETVLCRARGAVRRALTSPGRNNA